MSGNNNATQLRSTLLTTILIEILQIHRVRGFEKVTTVHFLAGNSTGTV